MMCAARLSVILLVAIAGGAGGARTAVPGQAVPRYNGTVMLGMDAKNLSEFLVFGLDAISTLIQIFEEDAEDSERILKESQRKLWKLVEKVAPDDPETMKLAREEWDRAFERAPDITQDLLDFSETGKTDKLIAAFKAIISTAFSGCSKVYPEEAKYFLALSDLVGGIGESWNVFSEGNATRAVQVIWDSLRVSIDDVFPEYADTIEMYKHLMGKLDLTVSQLSQHVLEYKRHVLNSQVCYRMSEYRERARPSECREGFEWDQEGLCFPAGSGNGAACLAPCGNKAGLCESFCGEQRACCRRGEERGPAECGGAQGFVDHTFAFGSPEDYHQCVRPGPSAVFTVGGAGVAAVNGLYVHQGSHSGKPRYVNVQSKGAIMEWSASREAWRFVVDRTLFGFGRRSLYTSKAATQIFPTAGWTAEDGVFPIPTITPFSRPAAPVPPGVGDAGAAAAGTGPVEEAAAVWSAGGPAPYGAHEAGCDAASGFGEKRGGWCLKACPAGFLPESAWRCAQACGGKFPAEGPGLCGTSKEQLILSVAEMASMVVGGTVEAYTLISSMQADGVAAEGLTNTIGVFVEMGKPFARPQCAVVEEAGVVEASAVVEEAAPDE